MLRKRASMGKMVVMLCVAALTACAGIALADPGGCGGEHQGRHQRHNFRKIAEKLELSDAQRAQARAIFQANRPVVQPILANLHTERQNLRALMHADTLDEAAIRAETARIAGIQADLNVNRARVNAQFRAILTPAQQATLNALRQGPAATPPAVPPAS